ncbi:hypothetical protein BAUCODRAFT_329525 [Baudoinia panamericana UAMH 10762]|uniref:Uncharacterized protein n=1 Tax=Baudoinia panamericana (strain UAMH 10762) TaxID=717646 RepID=M2MXT2_BAUPA|nr:uncharacterized protein BAUCODRAFT_329525 [Baudoinia panamericana UAMH 10762]EMC91464.1 hypothetical protein BAUCODRAFT_329525 [Baudoinia panamericana UAMH 10762]
MTHPLRPWQHTTRDVSTHNAPVEHRWLRSMGFSLLGHLHTSSLGRRLVALGSGLGVHLRSIIHRQRGSDSNLLLI